MTNYAAGTIATGGKPSPAATVGATSALGKKKYSVQGINDNNPGQPSNAVRFGPVSPQALTTPAPSYNTAANDWQGNIDQRGRDVQAVNSNYAASVAADSSPGGGGLFDRFAAPAIGAGLAANQQVTQDYIKNQTAKAWTDYNAAQPGTAQGLDLNGINGLINQASSASPFMKGSSAYVDAQNNIGDMIRQAYGGADQGVWAQSGASGHISSADLSAQKVAEAEQVGAAQTAYANEAPGRNVSYLQSVLGLQGGAIGNNSQAALAPANLEAVRASTRTNLDSNTRANQMQPGAVEGQSLTNQAAQGQIQMFRDSYQAMLAKQQAGAQLTQAEAAQAKFVADNPALMAVLGILPGLAQAGASFAGLKSVGA